MERLAIHDYMLVIAQAAAKRATCPRLQVGCVIANGNEVAATGYNGSLPHQDHCLDVGCLMHENHCLRTIHAESNALRQLGDRPATAIYCTHLPCYLCLKEILARGIRSVYYIDAYKPDLRRQLFLDSQRLCEHLIPCTPPTLMLVDLGTP